MIDLQNSPKIIHDFLTKSKEEKQILIQEYSKELKKQDSSEQLKLAQEMKDCLEQRIDKLLKKIKGFVNSELFDLKKNNL